MVLSTVNPLYVLPAASTSMYQQTDPSYYTDYCNRTQGNSHLETSSFITDSTTANLYPSNEAALVGPGEAVYDRSHPFPSSAPMFKSEEPYQQSQAQLLDDQPTITTGKGPTDESMNGIDSCSPRAYPTVQNTNHYYYGMGVQSSYGVTTPNFYFPCSQQPPMYGSGSFGESSQSINQYAWFNQPGHSQPQPPFMPNISASSSEVKEIAWCNGPNQGMKYAGRTRTREKYRMVYTDSQRLELEKEFITSEYISTQRKACLSRALGLSERQIKIWFQNRRAKKRKQCRRTSSASDGTQSHFHCMSQHPGPEFRSLPSFTCGGHPNDEEDISGQHSMDGITSVSPDPYI